MAVLKTATRNFRPDSLIGGEGGLGSVFKGWIHENSLAAAKPGTGGIAIAVKRLIQGGMQGLNLDGMQGHREWLAEVNFLGQFSHPHLVRLIGYCLEDEHCLLVYEFMSRGNLENHLFRRGSCSPLSWSLRLKVALDAAKGLAFLHSGENKVIYGGDFNASNILLDSSYNAKLSGFGLAKDGRPTGDKSYVTTRIMGNYGYAAPEYLATGHLTTESDVYSFGVVLLEMISGMRVVDKNRPYGQQNLVEWVKQLPLANKLKIFHLLDSQLEGQYSTDEVYRVLNLALQCLSTEIKDRPNMSEVVTILEQLQVKVSNVNGFNQDPNVNMSRSRRSIMSVISSFKF